VWIPLMFLTLAAAPDAGVEDHTAVCAQIARDIEGLRGEFPQLAEFSAARHLRGCHIDYTFRCHEPKHQGGWTSGVPNPDPDGVWFHIRLWDRDEPTEATAQIYTQPVVPRYTLGSAQVTFLILEGGKTKSLHGRLLEVMRGRGLKP